MSTVCLYWYKAIIFWQMLPLIVWDIIELSYPGGRQQCSGSAMIIAMVNWILSWKDIAFKAVSMIAS